MLVFTQKSIFYRKGTYMQYQDSVSIKSLPENEIINIEVIVPEENDSSLLPTFLSIKRIGANQLEVSCIDDMLNDLVYLTDDIEDSPLLQSELNSRLLRSFVRAIKKYAEGYYSIEIDGPDNYFSYTIRVSGITVGEALDKILDMYDEIEKENVANLDDIRKELING
jgi:hypothetical protein